jgi:hypothetical protein
LLTQGAQQAFADGSGSVFAAPCREAVAEPTQFFAQLFFALAFGSSLHFTRPALLVFPALVKLVPEPV